MKTLINQIIKEEAEKSILTLPYDDNGKQAYLVFSSISNNLIDVFGVKFASGDTVVVLEPFEMNENSTHLVPIRDLDDYEPFFKRKDRRYTKYSAWLSLCAHYASRVEESRSYPVNEGRARNELNRTEKIDGWSALIRDRLVWISHYDIAEIKKRQADG